MHNRPYPAQPRRAPVALVVVAVILALLLAAAVLAWLWLQWAALDQALPWLTLALRVLFFTAPPTYAGALVWRRWGDHRYIQAHHVTQLTKAQRIYPEALHSLSYHDSHKVDTVAPPLLELPAPEVAIAPIPSFAQLLDQGLIGPGRPLILGYDAATGQAITGSWKDLYSCGVGAQQGAGKTWLLAFLLAQSVAAGGRLIIADLHAGDPESLANRIAGLGRALMCDVATTPAEITAALKLADDKLTARKGNTARWPIVVCCDEWTSLLRTAAGAELPQYIQNIAEQGRKFNVNGLLAAQAWTKDASSGVRNQLTSHYVLRQRPDEARYQLGLRSDQLPDDVRSLPDASGYFLNVKGELTKIVIPKMTSADIARCGELIDRPASAAGQPFGFQAQTLPLTPFAQVPDANGTQTGSKRTIASTAPQRVKIVSPEAARAAGLYLGGKSIAEVAQEIRGVDITKGGRTSKPIREEVEQLIREGVQA